MPGFGNKARLRRAWNNAGTDVVVLHMLNRPGRNLPNLSPFVMKLETFLRATGIRYICDFEDPFGPKNKTPWITLNGEDYSDSQIIIEMLSRKYGVSMDKHLDKEQKAVAQAFRIMIEDHMVWGLAIERFVFDEGRYFLSFPRALGNLPGFMAKFAVKIFTKKIKKSAEGAGMGRHTKEELETLVCSALRSVSEYLGSKQFLMGDQPSVVDCSLFGLLIQFRLAVREDNVYRRMIEREARNLLDFTERMKKLYYKDWSDFPC